MIQCLKEVAGSASDSVPTLFRSMGADRIGKFHGLVVWAPNHRAIKLAVNSIEWKAKRIVTIQWAKQKLNKGQPTKELNTDMQGTEADLMICLQTLSEWVVNYGGPNGPSQWYVPSPKVNREGRENVKKTQLTVYSAQGCRRNRQLLHRLNRGRLRALGIPQARSRTHSHNITVRAFF